MTTKNRPKRLTGWTHKQLTGCGNLYITANLANPDYPEVFLRLGKNGQCERAMTEAIGRLISWGLRAGAPLDDIIEHLRAIECYRPLIGPGRARSCADAVAIVLSGLLPPGDGVGVPVTHGPAPSTGSGLAAAFGVSAAELKQAIVEDDLSQLRAVSSRFVAAAIKNSTCPECEVGELVFQEGCSTCFSCGYSKCS